MRIAIAQTEIIYEQYEKNKTVAHSLMDMAQAMDARLLRFPEMSFTGFTMHTDYSIPVGQETVSWILRRGRKETPFPNFSPKRPATWETAASLTRRMGSFPIRRPIDA